MRIRKGFTLIEILAVMGIIIVLMALILPTVTSSMQKANTATAKTILEKLEMAVRNYESAFGIYPPDLSYQYLGKILYSQNFGALRPVLQYEKNQTVDEDGITATIDDFDDLFYADPWGNRYYYFYYDDKGHGQGDNANKEATPDIVTLFTELLNSLKENTTSTPKKAERRHLILDPGPDPENPYSTKKLQQGFLIWSSGPDTTNGTEDDIGNWGYTRNKMI